jgi:hypothetical protein
MTVAELRARLDRCLDRDPVVVLLDSGSMLSVDGVFHIARAEHAEADPQWRVVLSLGEKVEG